MKDKLLIAGLIVAGGLTYSTVVDNLPSNVTIRMLCSKGTYVRSFARDLGTKLSSGGHLTELRRTKIGNYHINNAISIEDFEKSINLEQ